MYTYKVVYNFMTDIKTFSREEYIEADGYWVEGGGYAATFFVTNPKKAADGEFSDEPILTLTNVVRVSRELVREA